MIELNSKFKALKQLQLRHEDNLKEVREDERIEKEYIQAGNEFDRFLSILSEYADVLDSNNLIGKYVLQEDKSLTKMVIKKKQ